MAWDQNSRRRSELPPDWKQRVAAVWKRDGGQCRWILPSGKRCPRPGADVDHRYGPTRHEISDLWLLCKHHHDKKTQREAWAGKARRKPSKRPQERHPGAI